jgi:hypothetical protein
MIVIPRQLVVHPHADEQAAGQANDEADEIDRGEDGEFIKLPEGDL